MAERRMFAKRIIDSDAFTELPPTTQALYFHLCMGADDDGFNNQIRRGMFNAHADRNDFDLLVQKRFIIPFESGVIVIKHWRMHNLIKNDRYKHTSYIDEMATLVLKENGVYTESGTQAEPIWNPSGTQAEPQVRLGKDRLGKDRLGKGDKAQSATHLIDESSLSGPVKEKLTEWLKYKNERREGYKETGLKSLITQTQKYEQKYGSSAVIDIIGASMSSVYRGIVWDRLDKAPAKKTYTKEEMRKAAEYLDSGGTFLGDLFNEQYRNSEDSRVYQDSVP